MNAKIRPAGFSDLAESLAKHDLKLVSLDRKKVRVMQRAVNVQEGTVEDIKYWLNNDWLMFAPNSHILGY